MQTQMDQNLLYVGFKFQASKLTFLVKMKLINM